MSYSIHNLKVIPNGEVQITNTLNVTGTANLNAINVTGNLDVLGNISLNGNNIVNTDGSMEITGTAQLNALNVTGNTDIDGTLNVEDATTLQSSLDVQGTARLNALNVSGNAVFDNDYIKIGNINMGHNNDVGIVIPYIDSGVTKFSGLVRWQDNGTYFLLDKLSSESVNINGVSMEQLGELYLNNLTAFNKLGVGTSISPEESLNVSGPSYFDGNCTVIGDIKPNTITIGTNKFKATNNGVGINYTAPSNGTELLTVGGDINVAYGWRSYMIGGQSVLNSSTLGSGIVNSSLTSVGTLTNLNVSGNTDINGTLNVEDATTLQSSLDVQGTAQLNALNVTGDINTSTNYDIGGTLVLSSNTLGSGVVNSSLTSVGTLSSLNVNGESNIKRTIISIDNQTITNPGLLVKPNDVVGDDAVIEIRGARNASTTVKQSQLVFSNYDNDIVTTNYLGLISGEVTNASTNIGDLVFSSSSDGTTLTERMRITSGGNVGIGITNPSQKLDVAGDINTSTNYDIGGTLVLSSNTLGSGVVNSSLTSVGTLSSLNVSGPITLNVGRGDVYLENNANDNEDGAGLTLRTTSNPTNGNIFSIRSSGQAARLWIGQSFSSMGDNPLYFGFSGTSAEHNDTTKYNGIIASTGNVGIGTTNPSTRLHVYENTTSTGTSTGLTIEQDGTGDAVTQYLLTGGQRWVTGIDNSDSDKFKISSDADLNTNNRFTITTGGNVGIGTTNPSQKLEVQGGTKIKQVTQTNNNSGGFYSGLTFETPASGHAYGIGYNVGGKFAINYFNNDSTYSNFLTIDNSGNVGIGTTNPSQKLEVVGDVKCQNITRSVYNTGEVIFSMRYIQGVNLTLTAWPVYKNSTVDILNNFSYTPKSNNSQIQITFDCSYRIFGSGADNLTSQILVGGTVLSTKKQQWGSAVGSGTRGGIIFPHNSVYFNSSTSTILIKIRVINGSTDDDSEFIASDLACLHIQEVAL